MNISDSSDASDSDERSSIGDSSTSHIYHTESDEESDSSESNSEDDNARKEDIPNTVDDGLHGSNQSDAEIDDRTHLSENNSDGDGKRDEDLQNSVDLGNVINDQYSGDDVVNNLESDEKFSDSDAGNSAKSSKLEINESHIHRKFSRSDRVDGPPSLVCNSSISTDSSSSWDVTKKITTKEIHNRVGMHSQVAKHGPADLHYQLWPSLICFQQIILQWKCQVLPRPTMPLGKRKITNLSSDTLSSMDPEGTSAIAAAITDLAPPPFSSVPPPFSSWPHQYQASHAESYPVKPVSSSVIAFDGESKLTLEWAWRLDTLAPKPIFFRSVDEYKGTFIPMILEECRACCSASTSRVAQMDQDEFSRKLQDKDFTTKLYSGVIQACNPLVVAKNAFTSDSAGGNLLSSFFEQNHSKDMVCMQIHIEMIQESCRQETDWDFRSGDLIALRDENWTHDRCLLAMVQGWDPDVDITNPSTCQVARQRSNSIDFKADPASSANLTLVVCVSDSKTPSNHSESNSKDVRFTNVDIYTGVTFKMKFLGNTITSSREYQAVLSLSSFDSRVKSTILNRSCTIAGFEECQVSFDDNLLNTLTAPPNISEPLWSSLRAQYNDSQLQAIRAVCDPPLVYTPSKGAPISNVFSPPPDSTSANKSPFPLLFLQGPPGTGKTFTILGMVAVLLAGGVPESLDSSKLGKKVKIGASLKMMRSPTNRNSLNKEKIRILICAPSNTAINELIYCIKNRGILGENGVRRYDISVVRLGQAMDKSSANNRFAHHSTTNGANNGKAININDLTLDYLVEQRRNYLIRQQEQRSLATSQGGGMAPYLSKIPGVATLRRQILESADIVCCTLSGSGSSQLIEAIMLDGASTEFKSISHNSSKKLNFDVVIMDEAAQAVEPSTLIPFKFGPKLVIMVGDPKQLPATVFSNSAKRKRYDQSLFEFYNGKLLNAENNSDLHRQSRGPNPLLVSDRVAGKDFFWKPYHDDTTGRFRPLVLHDVYSGFERRVGTSYSNEVEADYILKLFKDLRQKYGAHCSGGIGIIAAYKAQMLHLKKIFRQAFGPSMGGCSRNSDEFKGDVEISTVDGFQGREKDIIIFSCVRSSENSKRSVHTPSDSSSEVTGNRITIETSASSYMPSHEVNDVTIGFMSDWQRLNVALTRAKYSLWIIGDEWTIAAGGGEKWQALIDHCERNLCMYPPRTEVKQIMQPNHDNAKSKKGRHNSYNYHHKSNKKHKHFGNK